MSGFFASCGREVLFHSEADPAPFAALAPHAGEVRCIDLNAKGSVVVSAGADARVVITHVERNVALMSFAAAEGGFPASRVSLSPSDMLLCGGFTNGALLVWDLKAKKTALSYAFRPVEVGAAAWSGEGLLAAGTAAGQIALLELRSGAAAALLPAKELPGVNCLAFEPTQRALLVAGLADGSLRFFDAQKLQAARASLAPHSEGCAAAAFLASSPEVLVSCGAEGLLAFSDLRERRTIRSVDFRVPLTALAVSAAATTVFVGSRLGELVAVDLRKTDEEFARFEGHAGHPVNALAAPRLAHKRAAGRERAGTRGEERVSISASFCEPRAVEEKPPAFSDNRLKAQTIASLSAKALSESTPAPAPVSALVSASSLVPVPALAFASASSLTPVLASASPPAPGPAAAPGALAALREELKDFVREEANALRLDLLAHFERQKEELRGILRAELARR